MMSLNNIVTVGFVPRYTSIESVQALLQFEITSSTHPSDNDVLSFIEEIEGEIDAKNLGNNNTGLIEFDMPVMDKTWKDSVALQYAGIPLNIIGRLIVPPFVPIKDVVSGSFAYNRSVLNATPDWRTLNEGPGTGTNFVILRRPTKNNVYVGYAIFLYGILPYTGRNRLRINYNYGWDLPQTILREYATLKVARKVLFARVMSGQPAGIASYRGPDLGNFVNTQVEVLRKYIDERIAEIEDKHMPRSSIAVAFL